MEKPKKFQFLHLTKNHITTTFSEIKHKNFKRIVTIYSGLSSGYTDAGAIVSQIENEMSNFQKDLNAEIILITQVKLKNKIRMVNFYYLHFSQD